MHDDFIKGHLANKKFTKKSFGRRRVHDLLCFFRIALKANAVKEGTDTIKQSVDNLSELVLKFTI